MKAKRIERKRWIKKSEEE